MSGEDRFSDYGAAGTSGVAEGFDSERVDQAFASLAHGPWSFDALYGKRRKHDPTAAYFSDPLVPGQYQGDAYALGIHPLYVDRAADLLLAEGINADKGKATQSNN